MEIFETKVKYGGYPVAGLTLKITGPQGQDLGSLSSLVGDKTTLSANLDSEGNVFYSFTLVGWREVMKVGDRAYNGFLLFRQNSLSGQDQLILESIVLRSGVITSIDKKRNTICHVELLKIINPFDGGVIVHLQETDSLLYEYAFLSMPPFIMCNQDNVSE